MALTWSDITTKMQRLSRDPSSDTQAQLQQDWNTGYHMFNAKLGRYYSRKQQFASSVTNQSIYQTPLDCVRILGMTYLVTSTYEPVVTIVQSEYEWRQIVSVKNVATNWPTNFFMIGNDEFQLWPTPSQSVTDGIRFYYQPQDHDLSVLDVTSTSTGATVTLVNGSTTVTASSGVFTAGMVGLYFQCTGVTDTSWYEILAVPTASTLTLKQAYVGVSASGVAWRIGQQSIIPQEYADAPMHYALSNYFSANGNEQRATVHMNTFENMIVACQEDYSSSSESGVVTGGDLDVLNIWEIPPPASAS